MKYCILFNLQSKESCTVGIGKLRHVSLSLLQDVLLNLYNVKVKVESLDKQFKSNKELPTRRAIDMKSASDVVRLRLERIFTDKEERKEFFEGICSKIIESKRVKDIIDQLEMAVELASDTVKEWKVENELFVGIIPNYSGDTILFEATIDDETNKLHLHWDNEKLLSDFLPAVCGLSQALRNESRQPSLFEYLAFQIAYYNIAHGHQGRHTTARCLGTPGFRPYTQTYMSLTDPGDGHVLGTTRFNDWMKGAIVHVEHLERPRHLPREKIESYRIPSIIDFARVRLHVGPNAPTTYFVGRCVKDSGDFKEDFLKIVNITAASATAAFNQGAAECKVSMEGLSTSQAVRYMLALRGQVIKKKRQSLSAAWNLNQVILDDYERENPAQLNQRMEIGTRAIEITVIGGFDKITWDGASDTYPSKCIMYQLTFEEALTIVHEAHLRGLVTYFSAGFKFNEIKHAVYAGVDGIGIGGAQVLRFMDSETGMHGPYMEENIPRIMESRDEAANSFRGKGVKLLARLDTMFYEGSISEEQNSSRQELFSALLNINKEKIEELVNRLDDVTKMKNEGNEPLIGRAMRLYEAGNPLLKQYFESESEWLHFLSVLKSYVAAKDVDSISEEYDSDPWLNARKQYRMWQWNATKCICRQTSFEVHCKSYQ